MRILFTIHHELDRNAGAPGALLALADALREQGHEADVLSHGDLPAVLGGRISLLSFPVMVAWHTLKVRHRYEVLDFASYDGWLASLLPRGFRPRVLAFRSHGLEHVVHRRLVEQHELGRERINRRYWLYRGSIHLKLIAMAARRSTAAFFLNQQERELAVRDLGVRPQRAKLTANGLIPAFRESAERLLKGQRCRNDDTQPNVATIGSYIPRKGIAYMMPAITEYLTRHPAARFKLLGTKCSRARVLQDLPERLHERVDVVPEFKRSDLPQLLEDQQIYLSASLAEGFSTAGLEAMASGLVPILTRGHGFETFARDGENALLIDRASTEQITQALNRLALDRAMWCRLRTCALQSSLDYTWPRVASDRVAAYQAAACKEEAR